MSSVAPPDPAGAVAAPPGEAPTAEAAAHAEPGSSRPPAPRARLPLGIDLVGAAVLIGTATLVVVASLAATSGAGLGGTGWLEVVLILAGGALTAAALATGGGVPGGLPVAAFGALAALTALSIVWAVDPNGAWLEANRTLSYAAAFAGAASLARLAREHEARFVGGLLLGLSLSCLVALSSKVVPEWLNEVERFARLREPFGYWNAVGLVGALTVPPALWLGTRRDGEPLVDALAYPAMTLAVTTMLLAYSRGSLLAAAVGAALWFALSSRRVRGAAVLLVGGGGAAFIAAWTFGQDALTDDGVQLADRIPAGRELLVLLVAVLVLLYLAGLALAFIADLRPLDARQRRRVGIGLLCLLALTPVAVAGMLATTDDGLGGSISTAWKTVTDPAATPPTNDPGRLTETGSIRARYWDDAFRMLDDRKLHGFGAGGYATVRPQYRRDEIDVKHAHGYLPQTLADLGFAGLVLSLVLLVAWALSARLALRERVATQRAALATLAAIAVIFGVHSFIDWTWFTPATALVGMLAAGWVAGVGPALTSGAGAGLRARQAFAAVAVLVTLTAAWAAWQPLRAQAGADRARELADERKFDDARDAARSAHDVNPLSAEPLLARAVVERQAGDKRAAERALQEAVDIEPANYAVWLRLGEFQLWVLDRPREALHSVRAAVYLNPGSFAVVQRYLDVSRTIRTREARERRR